MYDKSSIIIIISLFVLMLIVNQVAFEIGKRNKDAENTEMKSQSTAIQTGIIGLLALLLGFTFNMSLHRYDARSNAVIEESGAIARVAMQAKLMSDGVRSEVFEKLEAYLALRISLSQVDLSSPEQRKALNSEVSKVQGQLIALAQSEMENPKSTNAANGFFQALSNMIQIENKRTAMLRLHVPEPVLILLFCVFVTVGGMLGYNSGLGKKRPAFPTVLLFTLIVLVVFIIIDLDRPKRGIIKVNQDSLNDTQITLREYQGS
jgi:CHASE3 domain sensor protein